MAFVLMTVVLLTALVMGYVLLTAVVMTSYNIYSVLVAYNVITGF